jgi:hypothetical protein
MTHLHILLPLPRSLVIRQPGGNAGVLYGVHEHHGDLVAGEHAPVQRPLAEQCVACLLEL